MDLTENAQLIIDIMKSSGLRLSEVLKIHPEWINGGAIEFPEGVLKSGKAGKAYLPATLAIKINGFNPAIKNELRGVDTKALRAEMREALQKLGCPSEIILQIMNHEADGIAHYRETEAKEWAAKYHDTLKS